VPNADTLHRIFALMDEKDFPAIRDLIAPDFSAVFGSNPPMGVEEWTGMGQMMYAAFPDGKHTFDETYAIGDRVFSRARFSATHTGDFMGIPPTGKEITITELAFDRFAGGKLVEHRVEADMLGLMQ
jgi:predicted ester cyclase